MIDPKVEMPPEVVEPKLGCFVSREQGAIRTQPGEVDVIIDVLAIWRKDESSGCRIGRYGLN